MTRVPRSRPGFYEEEAERKQIAKREYKITTASRAAIESFDVDNLCNFLASTGNISEDGVQNFRKNLIRGSTLSSTLTRSKGAATFRREKQFRN